MDIKNYQTLITHLPVRQQCFSTKRATWRPAEKEIGWLESLNDKLFDNAETLRINRQDVFDTTDIREKILKTIYWGYPRNMRGNNFVDLLDGDGIEKIENVIDSLRSIGSLGGAHLEKAQANFKSVKCIGI